MRRQSAPAGEARTSEHTYITKPLHWHTLFAQKVPQHVTQGGALGCAVALCPGLSCRCPFGARKVLLAHTAYMPPGLKARECRTPSKECQMSK